MSAAGGWYPDPRGAFDYRWWDGTQWTERVVEDGVEASSPMPPDLHAAAPDPSTVVAEPTGDREADAAPVDAAPVDAVPGPATASARPAVDPAQQRRMIVSLAVAVGLAILGFILAVSVGGSGTDDTPSDDDTDAPFGTVLVVHLDEWLP